MADKDDSPEHEHAPTLRIIDRRWWAKGDARYRGAAAEFDEARARLRKEVARDVERGRRTLVVELLDVVDNLDRAIEAVRETGAAEAFGQGVELVHQQFLAKLEGFGVVRIVALDRPFDPALHEAVTTVPVDDPALDHVVVGVIRHGYAIGDEVLRPALVAVGRHETTTE